MSEYLDFTSEQQKEHGRRVLDALMLFLKENNQLSADDSPEVSDIPFPHNSALALRLIDESDPEDTEAVPSGIAMDVMYGPKDDPAVDTYYLGNEGTLYLDIVELDEFKAADFYRELEECFHIMRPGDMDDRRVSMRRCIGPLVIVNTLNQIDELNANLASAGEFKERIEKTQYAHLMREWLNPDKEFKTISEAVFGLAGILMADTGYVNDGILTKELAPELSSLSDTQQHLFEQFTYARSLAGNLHDTTGAQAQITATILVPAYLAAKYDCKNSESLLERLNDTSLEEILRIVKDRNFMESLETLPLAPNGTFRNIVHFNNERREIDDIYEDEELFEPGESKIDLLFKPFDSYGLYIKDSSGNILLNPIYGSHARYAVRVDSQRGLNDDNLTPTIGCPALIKRSRLELSDLTDEQLAAIDRVSGVELSMHERGYRLDFIRSVILELHKVHVNALDRYMQFATR